MARPTVARIELSALMHNAREIKKLTGGRKLCAVVKADGYGHGAPVAATALRAAGADMFGVATTEEAVELRECGINEPILLLTAVPQEDIDELLRHNITPCIVEEGFAEEFSRRARRENQPAPVHINVDTGMRRVGIHYPDAVDTVLRIANMPGIRVDGVFTHFARSDADDLGFCHRQLSRFKRVLNGLEEGGLEPPFVHAANSCAVLRLPEAHFDAVRPGLILYGIYPRSFLKGRAGLRPALSFRTHIMHLKRVAAGVSLGYGHTYTTDRPSQIATLPVGYHDGYIRDFSNTGSVLVRGHRAPVVGRICMDQTLVDVTDVPGVEQGDEVVLYGQQGDQSINVGEMAELVDGIPYELTCAIGRRVRREFTVDGRSVGEAPQRSMIPTPLLQKMSLELLGPDARKRASGDGHLGAA